MDGIFYLALFYLCVVYQIRAEYMDETFSTSEQEFCQSEFFNPQCPQGELILIESAKYGRMIIGKCIKKEELMMAIDSKDPKYFGCFSDVTPILYKKCSFKITCNVEVKDRELNHTTSCHSWLKSHLKINYQCLNAIQTDDSNCRILASQKAMHLIIGEQSPSKCGSRNNPWTVEALKGQKIKISQLKFLDDSQQNSLTCFGIGIIISDRKANRNVTICQNYASDIGKMETNNVYTSKGGIIEIFNYQTTDNSNDNEILNKLILEIEVDGCTDIIPPEDKWLRRTNDEIVIGCYSSKQTWYLQCERGRWMGTFGNCSDIKSDSNDVIKKSNKVVGMSEENQVLIIIAISAFGLVICLLIMCCGAMIVRKFKNEKPINLMSRESYYVKDGTNEQSHYGPVGYSTLNTAVKCENKNDTDEQRYFVLDENIVDKPN